MNFHHAAMAKGKGKGKGKGKSKLGGQHALVWCVGLVERADMLGRNALQVV